MKNHLHKIILGMIALIVAITYWTPREAQAESVNKQSLFTRHVCAASSTNIGGLAASNFSETEYVVGSMTTSVPPVIPSDNKETIEQNIRQLIEENKDTTPSVSISVFDDNHEICNIIYGESNIKEHIAADEETVYEWGSISKTLVWVSAMQLYEQGKLDLNADIQNYLPKGFLSNLSYDEPITMLNLMNHDAGFQDTYWELETTDINEIIPLGDAIKMTAPAQIYAPGERVLYSNWGAALAGYVIECISGMSYGDYVTQNIFNPLGMHHTSIMPDISDNEWVAKRRARVNCYSYFGTEMEDLGEDRAYIHLYPAGAACGTIEDLEIYASSFLCDSGESSLFTNEDTLNLMLTPSLYYPDGVTPRVYHGLWSEISGHTLVGHGGNTAGFSALMNLDLENRTGFVMMTNKRGDAIYKGQLPTVLYGQYETPQIAINEKLNLSGWYEIGSPVDRGLPSIYGFLYARLHVVNKDGSCLAPKSGIVSATQITDTIYEFELINGVKHLYFIQKDEDGNVKYICRNSDDFVKISGAKIVLDYFMFISLCLSVLVMCILSIWHLLRLRKYKDSELMNFKMKELFMGISIVCIPVMITVYYNINVFSKGLCTLTCIATALFTVASVGFGFACWKTKRKPGNKLILAVESLSLLFIAAGVIYWKMYQFWGF